MLVIEIERTQNQIWGNYFWLRVSESWNSITETLQKKYTFTRNYIVACQACFSNIYRSRPKYWKIRGNKLCNCLQNVTTVPWEQYWRSVDSPLCKWQNMISKQLLINWLEGTFGYLYCLWVAVLRTHLSVLEFHWPWETDDLIHSLEWVWTGQ